MTELTLVLNFIIIFLLVTAIVYGFILNRRINLIRNSGKELADLFRSFDDTILKAQVSIDDLKKVSGAISEGLQRKIDKSILLMDDLSFLNAKASEAADRVSNAMASFKRMEEKLPPIASAKSRNIVAMPLIMEQPGKSVIPEKSSLKALKRKALEDLLKEVSPGEEEKISKALPINNNSKSIIPKSLKNDEKSISLEKKQFSIASALKALGYGD